METGGGFCAAFLVFVSVGGFIAMAIAGPHTEERDCRPHYSTFGVTETKCESPVAEALWYGTVDFARFVVVFPSLAAAMFKSAAMHGNLRHLGEGLIWLLWSAPMMLMSWIGFRHIDARSPVVAWLLLIVLVAQILISGVRM